MHSTFIQIIFHCLFFSSYFRLCERVPYHLFMWLVGQAQEFVIGVKVQLLTLLYDRSIENLAEVFLTSKHTY